MTKTALVTGVTGQDGYFLSKLLLEKGYKVHGLIRGQNNPKKAELQKDLPKLKFLEGDLTDYPSLVEAMIQCRPDEVYNLGALTHVGSSFKQPDLTANVTGLGCLRLLEAIRKVRPGARFYQASTSELFGKVQEVPQTETTPFYPRSPYGAAKAFAHYTTVNYRESYGIHASCGILFNHESERRGPEFVTRKITLAAARIKLGFQESLELGNLDSYRDWGYAPDYVDGMWRMLQQDEPGDYVLATGEQHSIREVLDIAFGTSLGLDWKKYVKQNPAFMRPAEVPTLQGDASKAKLYLDWTPTMSFEDMIYEMTVHDYAWESANRVL